MKVSDTRYDGMRSGVRGYEGIRRVCVLVVPGYEVIITGIREY